ncbi:uncharacterized protein LOC125218183 isoform X2 [Salvia hispanica]|uniref:uncharacterized protein LOC125218183 isoform X2 n=1 Tax=Salvia hispanica TaxID=49212 RepID=UPI0020098812|nr:uncharacterized protein LOC125218183 isoform X2 [Salvia hispanica]
MPPRTRSNKMAGTSAEGEETSMTHPTPDGDLVSMMARMMKELKQEMMIQMDERAKESIVQSKESEARMLAAQNTLFEEFNTLKGGRTSRTPTSRGNNLPNVSPEEMMEEVVYEGWQRGNDRNRVNHMENDRFGGRNGARGRFKGDYESRYHGDGLDRGYSGKRAPKSHGEWYSRRVRDQVSHKGFERPIEEEVSYRTRLRPTYPHGGVDTNQRGNSSCNLATPSSFHLSHKSLDVYGNVSSSKSLIQISRKKEREREKRLESECESKKPRERDKRQECEVQKSRESGGGERKEKYEMREKPQAQVSKGCLLDSKVNLGWAPNDPLPLALGEETKPLPTNTYSMSFCVHEFVGNLIEGMEVRHHVVHGLETTHLEKEKEERGQVDELLAQGVRNPDLRANPFQEVENDMTMSARHQVSSPRREPWIDWGPRKSVKKCQGFNKARGSPEDARNREGLDLRTNPFQEGEDDTIIEAVRQGFQLQLDSTRNRPIEMISESYETTIIVFVLEIASRGYLAHLNRSPNEGVMAVLQKSRKTGEGVQREHPPWRGSPERTPGRVFCTLQFTRPGESPET